jgi:hypothetical protein
VGLLFLVFFWFFFGFLIFHMVVYEKFVFFFFFLRLVLTGSIGVIIVFVFLFKLSCVFRVCDCVDDCVFFFWWGGFLQRWPRRTARQASGCMGRRMIRRPGAPMNALLTPTSHGAVTLHSHSASIFVYMYLLWLYFDLSAMAEAIGFDGLGCENVDTSKTPKKNFKKKKKNIRTRPDLGVPATECHDLLRAVSRSNPDVGYCQGMSYLAVLFLQVTRGGGVAEDTTKTTTAEVGQARASTTGADTHDLGSGYSAERAYPLLLCALKGPLAGLHAPGLPRVAPLAARFESLLARRNTRLAAAIFQFAWRSIIIVFIIVIIIVIIVINSPSHHHTFPR